MVAEMVDSDLSTKLVATFCSIYITWGIMNGRNSFSFIQKSKIQGRGCLSSIFVPREFRLIPTRTSRKQVNGQMTEANNNRVCPLMVRHP